MAIPSGAGTEVLKRISTKSTASQFTTMVWDADQTTGGNSSGTIDVPADHIHTIISIYVCNTDTAVRKFHIQIENTGLNSVYLIQDQTLQTMDTFIVNDRFVLYPDDRLRFYTNEENIWFWVSYIDQHY